MSVDKCGFALYEYLRQNQLYRLTESDLLKFLNLRFKSLRHIKEALEKMGLSLKSLGGAVETLLRGLGFDLSAVVNPHLC